MKEEDKEDFQLLVDMFLQHPTDRIKQQIILLMEATLIYEKIKNNKFDDKELLKG